MRTEIRAFYGGIELGIAGVMILLWRMKQAAIGLIVGGVPLAGSALGRFLGMSLEGIDSTHLVLAGFELLGSFTCLLAAYLHGSIAPRK